MQLTYKDSGVNIAAGAELVRRITPAVQKTRRPEQLTGLGGFAALATLPRQYREPVLVTGTDGVGTKLKLAIDQNRHDSVGQDLVAMCANDVLVTGAEPFLFLDYYASASLDVDIAARVVTGIARGCELAGCALVGGETAEMPGFYNAGDYDLAGFCVGVVERSKAISGHNLRSGDRIIGLPSSGPHANGYSLIRRILADRDLSSSATFPEGDLLDQLLQPTRIYAKAVLQLHNEISICGMAHITGGGLLENIPRLFSGPQLCALIDLDRWQQPDIFSWLQQAGNIATEEMLRTFNCGIGYVICVAEDALDDSIRSLTAAGETPLCIGRIVSTNDLSVGSSQLAINRTEFRLG